MLLLSFNVIGLFVAMYYHRKKNLLFGKKKFAWPYEKKSFLFESVRLFRWESRRIQAQVYWFGCPDYVLNLMINRYQKYQLFNQIFNAIGSKRSKPNI